MRPLVVVTTVSSDAHTWNLVFLQLMFEDRGWEVANLGPCVGDECILDAARTLDADLLAVSSLNGNGYTEGLRLITRLRADPSLTGLPAIIGGKLDVSGADAGGRADDLLAAGFDAVHLDGTDAAPALEAVIARARLQATDPGVLDRATS